MLSHEATLAPSEVEPLSKGDRVALKTDAMPERYKGTIVDAEYAGRLFVLWDNGRTWIYATTDLMRV